jgi:peptidyl-prolyl cis-trans isomerase B (cyclophilin B)
MDREGGIMRGFWKLAILTLVASFGCGKSDKPASPTNTAQPTLSVPNSTEPVVNEEQRLHQPFDEAVALDSPNDQQPPPDTTVAGLPTSKVRLQVQKSWDAIRFTVNGKPLAYHAVLDTEMGRIKIRLRPDVAPNHVRNFVALAQAGYYNGLVFEQLIQQPGDDGPDSGFELVEAGCPLGTGEPGVGHLGYWVRPEFVDNMKHEPGTVGAYHEEDPESAGVRFYVTLSKAPAMDGNFTAFGQVVEGLDVVRTISKQPKVDGTVQPVKPATIRSVTIEIQEVR